MTVEITNEEAEVIAQVLRSHLVTLWAADRRRGHRALSPTRRDEALLASVLSRVVRGGAGGHTAAGGGHRP